MKINGVLFGGDEYVEKPISRSDVTASRELGTNYLNGSRPKFCIISALITVTKKDDDNAILFGVSPTTDMLRITRFSVQEHVSSTHYVTMYEWVEPDYYYSASEVVWDLGSVELVRWEEIDF